MLDKQQTRLAFSKAATTYDDCAILQQQMGQTMLQRLEYIQHQPKVMIDIGSGTGLHTQALKKFYPNADVIALDFALPMLKKQQKRGFFSKKPLLLCADMEMLPIQSKSVDLIFSNAAVQWSNHLEDTFKEWFRILKPNGLIMFSTFGPSTLYELKQAWQAVEESMSTHVNPFMDLHEIGDLLLKIGFSQPVIDRQENILTYTHVKDLMRDLKGIGAHNTQTNRRKTLTGKKRLAQMIKAYETFRKEGVLPATYEVIYGHAWAANLKQGFEEQRIPVASILHP